MIYGYTFRLFTFFDNLKHKICALGLGLKKTWSEFLPTEVFDPDSELHVDDVIKGNRNNNIISVWKYCFM